MHERTRYGRALNGAGSVIALDVELTERVESGSTPVDLPGTGRRGSKPYEIRHPTTILFGEILDDQFREDLRRLAAAAADVDIGRRDRQWRPPPINLVLDDGEQLVAVHLDRPMLGIGPPESLAFPARHDRL